MINERKRDQLENRSEVMCRKLCAVVRVRERRDKGKKRERERTRSEGEAGERQGKPRAGETCEANKDASISGGNGEGDPPVPIPNTEVKPFSADGTWLVTARESRSPPDSTFLSSSMAEHSAVNRRVVSSNLTWGANKP